MENEKTINNYCRQCRNYNQHEILFQKENRFMDEFNTPNEVYMTLACLGCGSYSFRYETTDYDLDETGEWELIATPTLYPPSIPGHRDLDYLYLLPTTIQKIYIESITALKAKCNILAGAGFRAVIEAICIDKKKKGRTLEQMINNLQKEGLITKYECDRLHSIRFLGNDSIHEMIEPTEKQLNAVLKITEHLLNNIYILDISSLDELDTLINSYQGFIGLVELKMLKFKVGDELPLIHLLEKDIRRVKEKFADFEKDLIAEINNHQYKYLSLGGNKPYKNLPNSIQHFVIQQVPEIPDELPF